MGRYNVSEMPRVMRRYAKSIEKEAEREMHGLAQTALTSFASGTPTDTNRALSNWRVSVSRQSTAYVPTRSPGATQGSGSGLVQADVIAAGMSKIKTWKLGRTLFIQNNAPYIMRLENGWSRRQPGAFIASGLQAMKLRAKQIKILKQL